MKKSFFSCHGTRNHTATTTCTIKAHHTAYIYQSGNGQTFPLSTTVNDHHSPFFTHGRFIGGPEFGQKNFYITQEKVSVYHASLWTVTIKFARQVTYIYV